METETLCEHCKNAIHRVGAGQGKILIICPNCSLLAATNYLDMTRGLSMDHFGSLDAEKEIK